MHITPRQLVYLYVALVILEGPLRKWVLPGSLGSFVAISRDPIALYLVWHGIRLGLFRPGWLRTLWLLTSAALAVGGLLSMFTSDVPLAVWAFGLRTNCLHFPLILIIPALIEPSDLDKLLRRLLMLALPIALLMVWQYRSPIDSFINSSALEGVSQLYAVEGKVRPPGPFTYNTGASEYFALINAFLFGGLVDRRLSVPWLIYGLSSTMLAVSVSGSRLMMATLAVVWFGALGTSQLRDFRIPSPRILLGVLGVATVLVLLISTTPLGSTINEGWSTTSDRLESANKTDGGVLSRAITAMTVPERILWQSPVIGYGLGLGTNFGAKAISGEVGFALAESEFERLILESGLMVAGLFLVMRWCFGGHVITKAWQAIGRNQRLPVGLCFANIVPMMVGQIARPTSMGFVVLCMAFSLVAAKASRHSAPSI
ncbi:MAG: hypothetical protein VKN56_10700 [Cyanobacteriota bacterium]|nr:hypothetical protein [Cyanobacteriota bacterium]